jgi:hypothetical protein
MGGGIKDESCALTAHGQVGIARFRRRGHGTACCPALGIRLVVAVSVLVVGGVDQRNDRDRDSDDH